ncbi:MAG: hypothetical protein DHS20C11_05180 [Lysobacteraceae bacterium]|nr:MAG: hypothetical protein DHS20C11_05180 [Xanthomonadaceae bacterium]
MVEQALYRERALSIVGSTKNSDLNLPSMSPNASYEPPIASFRAYHHCHSGPGPGIQKQCQLRLRARSPWIPDQVRNDVVGECETSDEARNDEVWESETLDQVGNDVGERVRVRISVVDKQLRARQDMTNLM